MASGSVSSTQWTTSFLADSSSLSQTFQKNTSGILKVPAPALVANPRQPLFSSGECW